MKNILFNPVNCGDKIIKNRFCIQPMECCASKDNGLFSRATLDRYEHLCRGGAGLITIESVTLQYESRARKNQLLLDLSDVVNRKNWETFIREKKAKYPDTLIIVQLNHSGELSSNEFSKRITVNPMAGLGGTPVGDDYVTEVINSFVNATQYLYEIGFDGVDLKFCHGYFGSQVLRPYNTKLETYGGDFSNRSRFAFEMVERIRDLIPDNKFLVGAKTSMFEGIVGGQGHLSKDSGTIDLKESLELCKGLEKRGCNFFIETLGHPEICWSLMAPNRKNIENVYIHLAMAREMKSVLKKDTLVVAGGLSALAKGAFKLKENLTSLQYNCSEKLQNLVGEIPSRKNPDSESQESFSGWNSLLNWGEFCISRGYFDMIGLGRQSLADPYLPNKVLKNRSESVNWCLACDSCTELLLKQENVGCPVYNEAYCMPGRKPKVK